MKELIIKKEKNPFATREKFLADMEVLFEELKNSYGGYEYFGEERFALAKEKIVMQIEVAYNFDSAVSILREELAAFIYDGHFSVDGVPLQNTKQKSSQTFDYAVKQYEAEEIPVFDIKRFYYDNEEEKRQLEEFAKSGEKYRNCPYLIFDLRKNNGGSDAYLWEFLKGMTGEEPDAPIDFLQKNSDTFLAFLKEEYGENDVEPGVETYKSEGKMICTGQKIFVIIDRFVCSSGESAIANLKTIEGTVVVGENSGGCYFSGNCINIYLPNTGICVYYGTGRVLYHGTQNIDELGGFAPDIYGKFEVEDVVAMAQSDKREKQEL